MYRRHFITMKPLKLFKNRFIFSTNAKTTLKDNNLIFCDRNKNLYSIKNLHIGNLPFMAFLNLDNMSILTEFYSFREITVSYVFEEFIVFGTKENKIILCNSFCKILDTLVLNGTISGLHSYENNIYVSTKNGVLYRSTIFKNKLFILAKKETDFRILDIQFSKHLFTVDSGGYLNIYSYDLKFISSFSFYVPLLKIGISCNYLFLSATNGHIFSIRIPRNFKPCIEQKTSKRFLRSRLCKYLVKKETNATYIYSMDTKILCKLKKHKLHENSIFTIAVERDFLVCGGDDHKMTILDIKKDVANAKIAHSSSVKDIFIKDDVIYSLSSDSTIKLWDTKLNLLKTIKVSTPKPTVMVACKNFIMVLGNGIEKFPF